MAAAIYPALFFTVALLVATAYFLMGGLPLLTLKHDTPVDARFVRNFFNLYYRCAFWAAAGAALSYALWGRLLPASGAAAVAVGVWVLKQRLLPALEQAGLQIERSPADAIARFRRIHGTALLMNLLQLVLILWGLSQVRL